MKVTVFCFFLCFTQKSNYVTELTSSPNQCIEAWLTFAFFALLIQLSGGETLTLDVGVSLETNIAQPSKHNYTYALHSPSVAQHWLWALRLKVKSWVFCLFCFLEYTSNRSIMNHIFNSSMASDWWRTHCHLAVLTSYISQNSTYIDKAKAVAPTWPNKRWEKEKNWEIPQCWTMTQCRLDMCEVWMLHQLFVLRLLKAWVTVKFSGLICNWS